MASSVNFPSANSIGLANDISWANPGSAYAEDGTNMSATSSFPAFETSDIQYFTGFGYSIPTNATIDGIILTIKRRAQYNLPGGNGGTVTGDTLMLLKGGSMVGNNIGPAVWSTTLTSVSYGSSTDLWGTTWSPSDINASNFGLAVAVDIDTTSSSTRGNVAYVDVVKLEVFYTVPSGGTATANMLMVF